VSIRVRRKTVAAWALGVKIKIPSVSSKAVHKGVFIPSSIFGSTYDAFFLNCEAAVGDGKRSFTAEQDSWDWLVGIPRPHTWRVLEGQISSAASIMTDVENYGRIVESNGSDGATGRRRDGEK